MMLFLHIVLLLSTALVNAVGAEKSTVFPERVVVKNGEGLTLRLMPKTDPLRSCNVTFHGQIVDLTSNNSLQSSLGVEYWGSGLSQGDCGVHVLAYDASIHEGKWVFKASLASDNVLIMAVGELLTADELEVNNNKTILAELGKSISIPCEPENVLYCSLTAPSGMIISGGSNCTSLLPVVTMADDGVWKCTFASNHAVLEQQTYITLSAESDVNCLNNQFSFAVFSSRSFDLGKDDIDIGIGIYCNSLSKNIDYCRLEAPNGMTYIMAEGRIAGRYSYYGRGIANNDCGLFISKPLQAEDFGTWVCTFGLNDGSRNGGFISVEGYSETKEVAKRPSHVSQSSDNIVAMKDSSVTMTCSMKTPLDYCWFQHPNGTRFHPHPTYNASSWFYHGDGLDLGQCGMVLAVSNVSDSGRWVCGMGVRDEDDISLDFQGYFQVTIVETILVEERSSVVSTEGSQAILSCRSVQGQALQYCSFTAPNGTTYNLTPPTLKSTKYRYSYVGNGLENGDCGLIINRIESTDFGTWQCRSMLVASQDGVELHRDIQLYSPNLLSASAVGGIAAAAVLLVGMCAYFAYGRAREWRRARLVRPVAFSVRSDGSEDDASEVVIHPQSIGPV